MNDEFPEIKEDVLMSLPELYQDYQKEKDESENVFDELLPNQESFIYGDHQVIDFKYQDLNEVFEKKPTADHTKTGLIIDGFSDMADIAESIDEPNSAPTGNVGFEDLCEEFTSPRTPSAISKRKRKFVKRGKRSQKFSRWGKQADKALFQTLRELEIDGSIVLSELIVLSDDELADISIIKELAEELGWKSVLSAFANRIKSLAQSDKFSVRDIKLLKKILFNEYRNKAIDYQRLIIEFPGKSIDQVQSLVAEIESKKLDK